MSPRISAFLLLDQTSFSRLSLALTAEEELEPAVKLFHDTESIRAESSAEEPQPGADEAPGT